MSVALTPQVIILPLPPSVNSLTFNVGGKGRVKTNEYSAWITAAGWELKLQHPPIYLREATRVRFVIDVNEKMKGDIDNRIKPILDLYVRHRVIGDDRFVWGASIDRSPLVEAGKCHVVVTEVSP